MGYFYCKMICLISNAEILNPIRPLLRIQPNLTVSIFLDHPVHELKGDVQFEALQGYLRSFCPKNWNILMKFGMKTLWTYTFQMIAQLTRLKAFLALFIIEGHWPSPHIERYQKGLSQRLETFYDKVFGQKKIFQGSLVGLKGLKGHKGYFYY